MKKYDVFVIGAGPGGYSSVIQLKDMGYSVAVAEQEQIGGTCLNYGCIPTKFLLQKAKEVKISNMELDDSILCEWQKEKDSMLFAMRNNMENVLKNKGIELYKGVAEAKKEKEGFFTIQVGEQKFEALKVVVATGSLEQQLPITGLQEGLNSGFVLSSKQMLECNKLIRKLTIIGGGIIGFEFASFWNMLGCEVAILEKEETVLPQLDEDIRKQYIRAMEKKGIVIYMEAFVQEVDDDENCVIFKHGQQCKMLECDKVLLAAGRQVFLPSSIHEIGEMEQENLHLIGDCNGKLALAHAAYEEAKVLNNCLQGIDDSVCYELIPKVIYSNPEVAWVGKTESQCIMEDIEYYCCKKSMSYSSKYFIENRKEPGMCKLIFESATHKLLGAQFVGNGSGELISFIKLAIEKEMTKNELVRFTFPHPSISEIIYEVLI